MRTLHWVRDLEAPQKEAAGVFLARVQGQGLAQRLGLEERKAVQCCLSGGSFCVSSLPPGIFQWFFNTELLRPGTVWLLFGLLSRSQGHQRTSRRYAYLKEEGTHVTEQNVIMYFSGKVHFLQVFSSSRMSPSNKHLVIFSPLW